MLIKFFNKLESKTHNYGPPLNNAANVLNVSNSVLNAVVFCLKLIYTPQNIINYL